MAKLITTKNAKARKPACLAASQVGIFFLRASLCTLR